MRKTLASLILTFMALAVFAGMPFLDNTTRKVQVILAAAKASQDMQWTASYTDFAAYSSGIPMTSVGTTNGTSAVDVVGAPAASTSRKVLTYSLYNADSAPATVTLRLYDTGPTYYSLWTGTLNVGDTLRYVPETDFVVTDSSGNVKTIATSTALPQIGTSTYHLSTVSGAPYQTATLQAATTLYAVPCAGKYDYVYNTATGMWDGYLAPQLSLALTGLTASTLYDIFEYASSGVLTLSATAWSSTGYGTSTRATALTYQNGVLCKTGALNYRYLGTVWINGSGGQIDMVFASTNTTAPQLGIWSYYNRKTAGLSHLISAANWSGPGASWRIAGNVAAHACIFVVGVAEEPVAASAFTNISGASSVGYSGLCMNSSTGGTVAGQVNTTASTSVSFPMYPPVGLNYIAGTEYGSATFYGSALLTGVSIVVNY